MNHILNTSALNATTCELMKGGFLILAWRGYEVARKLYEASATISGTTKMQ